MGHLFSKKRRNSTSSNSGGASPAPPGPSRVTEQDRAILQLKSQKDKMKMYVKKLEKGLEKDRHMAKDLLSKGQKSKALLLLRKKKHQESIIEKALVQIDNLDRMVSDIEQAQMQIDVVSTLDVGNKCLKSLHQLMSVEDVEKIMEDTRESVDYQNEIDAILSGVLTSQDEEDCARELDALLAEDAAGKLPEVPREKLPQPAKVADRPKKVPAEKVALPAS